MQRAEHFPPHPKVLWERAVQLGVTHAVSFVPNDQASPDGERLWHYSPLLHMKERLRNADQEIAQAKELIGNMGAVGIKVACWNWMAVFNWMRTSVTIPPRGSALVTGCDHRLMQRTPLTSVGEVTEENLWSAMARFLEQIVPVAEEAGVIFAIQPHDPSISPIRGVARSLRTPDPMMKVTELAPSPNSRITFCQGSFATTRAHNPKEIGFNGPLRPDHVPTMAGEDLVAPGYDTLGRLYALGDIKGIHQAVSKLA
jgi:mannonate dehydratase